MCLMDYRETKEGEYSGVGYKIFRKSSNRRLLGEYGKPSDKKVLRPVNKWLNKNSFAAAGNYYSFAAKYIPGWHIYLERPKIDSRSSHYYFVRKIRYKKARLVGRCINFNNGISWNSIKSVVADEIFIEKEK